MLPLSLFRNGLFSLTSFVIFLVNVAFYGLIFVLSLYFFLTGLAFVPMIGAVLVANLVTARAAERFGALATIATGAAIVCGRRLYRPYRDRARHELLGHVRAARRDCACRSCGSATNCSASANRRPASPGECLQASHAALDGRLAVFSQRFRVPEDVGSEAFPASKPNSPNTRRRKRGEITKF